MKEIETIHAVGHVLCHDLTRIVPGEMKDAQFRKGHIVTKEDIPMLLSMGKEHLFVWEADETMLHEDEAAARLAALCENEGMRRGPAKEGKIELYAERDGLFVVDAARLDRLNMLEGIMVATRHGYTAVRAGDKLCGTRVIPLVIEKTRIEEAERLAGETPLLALRPFVLRTAAVVATGSEIQKGLIEDAFTPVVEAKLRAFGVELTKVYRPGDERAAIVEAIHAAKKSGADMILCTGGMSVDPDDRTPAAIKASGAHIISYGAPVLPGAMFLLSYLNDGTPLVGLPGCVMYARASIFDIVLPRLLAREPITKAELCRLGQGGLCLGCETCTYPNCGFGKG